MLGDLSGVSKIYLITGRTDMRKSFDGLMAIIRDTYELDPYANAVYLFYSLFAFDIAKGFYGMGAGVRQGLNYDEVKQIKLLSPPLPEQRRIADYLDEKCAAIDTLVAEKEKLIADLEAYKKSLIFELVTGKRDLALPRQAQNGEVA